MGNIVAEIFLEQMPLTASNFLDLASSGFYDGLHFHRVIPQFMAQFGCPFSRDPRSGRAGTGGPKPGFKFRNLLTGEVVTRGDDGQGGGTIMDEHTTRISNERGTLSMANAGPNTGGSQFFMNVVHNDFLDWFNPRTESEHPVFGQIIQGMQVVDAITLVPAREDCPLTPITMISVSVQQAAAAPQAAVAAPQAAEGQAAVKEQIGDWLVCEDAEGIFYYHSTTGQSYDRPPPELQKYLQRQAPQPPQQEYLSQQQLQQQQLQQQMLQKQQLQQQLQQQREEEQFEQQRLREQLQQEQKLQQWQLLQQQQRLQEQRLQEQQEQRLRMQQQQRQQQQLQQQQQQAAPSYVQQQQRQHQSSQPGYQSSYQPHAAQSAAAYVQQTQEYAQAGQGQGQRSQVYQQYGEAPQYRHF